MSQEVAPTQAPPLGVLLRRYRDARNWSQQKVADECELDGAGAILMFDEPAER